MASTQPSWNRFLHPNFILLFLCLCLMALKCRGSEVSVKLSEAPPALSNESAATFSFQAFVKGNAGTCSDCGFSCELDHKLFSHCEDGKETYLGLGEGQHFFKVCSTNGSQEVGCTSYSWTVDTVPPTAHVTASTPFTNARNISVNISFSEPCRGGFECSSVETCDLLVYGAAKVVPPSLTVLEPNLKYNLLVSIAPDVQYELVMLVMDKDCCTDAAGNRFSRTENSSFYINFDRRNVFVSLKFLIPEKVVQLENQTRTVLATNSGDLRFYLYFSQPLLNSLSEILDCLNTSQGLLLPDNDKNFVNHVFYFRVANVPSAAVVTVSFTSTSLISKQSNAVSPITPVTFLHDTERPAVWLSTTSNFRTTKRTIRIAVVFMKPVFDFNSSSILISGGHLLSFHEISRNIYSGEIRADIDGNVSVSIPEGVTEDIAGNSNLPSNVIQVRHYSLPLVSAVVSGFATVAFLATSLTAGLLTVSMASSQSMCSFSRPSLLLTSNPSRNLFRIACHIQVFALSHWLPVRMPIECYELARKLQWSIPYFNLPWEVSLVSPSRPETIKSLVPRVSALEKVSGSPLYPTEYQSLLEIENTGPKAAFIWDQHATGWRDFNRNMFWLAVIGGGFILLHGLLLLILKLKKCTEKQRSYGALTFPRFEIFLLVVALPCVCQASAAVIKGGTSSGVIVGSILLGFVLFVLLASISFLSVGVIHMKFDPFKRSQWTWKGRTDSIYHTLFGPLFEDLRGPPKYMIPLISEGNSRNASNDDMEDAGAPFIKKLLGTLRIHYKFLELVKRVCLGIFSGAYLRNNPLRFSRTPGITLLCITSFQLFFLIVLKPFIKKRVQLVDIVSTATEVGLFAFCVALLKEEFPEKEETPIGICMVGLFLVGFLAQMVNEWCALYSETKRLDPEEKSFLSGLKVSSYGILALFVPLKMIPDPEANTSPTENADPGDREDPESLGRE